jgi:iron uptake system component EfeO
VSQQDLIPPTLAYQKWIQARTVELAKKTDALRDAVDRGDLAAARAAWLPAHLPYAQDLAAQNVADTGSASPAVPIALAAGLVTAGTAAAAFALNRRRTRSAIRTATM